MSRLASRSRLTPILLVAEDSIGNAVGLAFVRPRVAGSGNIALASTQQRINDGFDVNHGRVEKLDACVAGVAQ